MKSKLWPETLHRGSVKPPQTQELLPPSSALQVNAPVYPLMWPQQHPQQARHYVAWEEVRHNTSLRGVGITGFMWQQCAVVCQHKARHWNVALIQVGVEGAGGSGGAGGLLLLSCDLGGRRLPLPLNGEAYAWMAEAVMIHKPRVSGLGRSSTSERVSEWVSGGKHLGAPPPDLPHSPPLSPTLPTSLLKLVTQQNKRTLCSTRNLATLQWLAHPGFHTHTHAHTGEQWTCVWEGKQRVDVSYRRRKS